MLQPKHSWWAGFLVPLPNSLVQSFRLRDVLPTGLDDFWFPALPVRKPFPAQTCTFPNGWLNPPLSIRFFIITQSFTLPSIIETRQAAPRPTSTSTNMTELCMLSCSKRDSLQSGRDLHNLCSLGHQCDPSCNSSQSPPPPPAGIRRHELTGTDKLLWPVTSAQTSYHLTSPDRPLMSASRPDCLTRCGGSSQRVFTLWNTKREGDAFAVQCQCEGDWRRSTQGLSPLTLRQGLTHQCLPYKTLPTITIDVFIWTHGTEVAVVSHSAGILVLIEIWSN